MQCKPSRSLRVLLLGSLVLSAFAQAQGSTRGNGGNFVKERFIRIGRHLQNYWANTLMDIYLLGPNQEWWMSVKGERIPFDRIRLVLDEANIEVSSIPIFDSRKSKVSAKVDEESPVDSRILKIVLDELAWAPHLANEEELRLLVCHEIMRSLRVNDDGSRICSALMHVYSEKRVPIASDFEYERDLRVSPKVFLHYNELRKTKQATEQALYNLHEKWLLKEEKEKLKALVGVEYLADADASYDFFDPKLSPQFPEEKATVFTYSESSLTGEKSSLEILVQHLDVEEVGSQFKFKASRLLYSAGQTAAMHAEREHVKKLTNDPTYSSYRSDAGPEVRFYYKGATFLERHQGNAVNLLTNIEVACVEKQQQVLQKLRDASSNNTKFAKLINTAKIEKFEILFTQYSSDVIKMLTVEKVIAADKAKLKLIQSQKARLSIAPDNPKFPEGPKVLYIEVPMPDGECKAISSEELQTRLGKLILRMI